MKSKIIVIEGLDGSGKATQTALLAEKLGKKGLKVRRLEYPDYDSPASALVKMYLGGEFGSKPEDVNAYCAFLCDRYSTSNIIYQMAKVADDKRDAFIDWQDDFEYVKLGLPKPDRVIYLDVSPDVSQRLMEKRYGGDLSKKDLHESNLSFLLTCRKSALYAAEKCGWTVIDCCENGEIKPIEKISEEIEKAVSDILC